MSGGMMWYYSSKGWQICKPVVMLIVHMVVSQRILTEMQKLIMDMYFNDGHTYEFMVEFFTTIFPEEKDLVVAYLDDLYAPKLLEYIELEFDEE